MQSFLSQPFRYDRWSVKYANGGGLGHGFHLHWFYGWIEFLLLWVLTLVEISFAAGFNTCGLWCACGLWCRGLSVACRWRRESSSLPWRWRSRWTSCQSRSTGSWWWRPWWCWPPWWRTTTARSAWTVSSAWTASCRRPTASSLPIRWPPITKGLQHAKLEQNTAVLAVENSRVN